MKCVKYIGAAESQIKWGNCADPHGVLELGWCYEVEHIEVHSWHTKYYLRGFPGLGFNSVCFEESTPTAASEETALERLQDYLAVQGTPETARIAEYINQLHSTALQACAALHAAHHVISDYLEELGECDHTVGICFCVTHAINDGVNAAQIGLDAALQI